MGGQSEQRQAKTGNEKWGKTGLVDEPHGKAGGTHSEKDRQITTAKHGAQAKRQAVTRNKRGQNRPALKWIVCEKAPAHKK